MVKQLRQVVGVRQVKVVDFKKGVFALTPKEGVRLSQASVEAAVKLSGFTFSRMLAPTGRSSTGQSVMATPPDAVDKLLVTARRTFRNGDVERAAKMAAAIAGKIAPASAPVSGSASSSRRNDADADNKAESRSSPEATVSPRDADALLFVALVSFSEQNYDDAAKNARRALQRGQPWDWKTLSGHYAESDTYIAQLRKLERSIRSQSTPKKRFLVACHYWMMGHHQAARTQFEKALAGEPDDRLIPELLKQLGQSIQQPQLKK